MLTYKEIQSLNDLELEVYNYIISNKDKVADMKIRELAEKSHVSTTTVLRFCKKMGCDGYSEFKLKYKLYGEENQNSADEIDANFMIDYFKKVNNKEFDDKLNEVAKLIAESDKVVFIGIGTSGILGKYGARYLSNIGKFVQYITDPYHPVPKGYYEDSVVIALSVSGETEQIINHVNKFKSYNCKIVSITNSETSTLSKISDITLAYYMPIDLARENLNITSQVPVVYMIEVIGRKLKKYI